MKTTSFLVAAASIVLAGCAHLPAPPPAPPADAAPKNTAPAAGAVPAATNAPVPEREDDAYREIRLLTKAIMIIRNEYFDDGKTSYSNLIHSALGGMVQSLDPFSQFMEPKGYKDLKEETTGQFGGIGIQIGTKDGALSVIAPIEDTPAQRAGILAGDIIAEIEGKRTDGFNVSDAVRLLRGEPGSKVRLRILRNKEPREFTLIREHIKISSIKGTRMIEPGIGYIRITEFSEPTGKGLAEALEKLTQQGLKALVLDLRNNPGGLLMSAVEVSQLFLPKDTLIVSTRGRGNKARQPPAYSGGSQHYTDVPMAVLVNRGSASAAEIVAGALQDCKRAVLVGETTFGKGSVQNVVPLDDGTALRLTTARYYTPSGRCIHEKGIEPDIAVPMTAEEWQGVLLKRAHTENPELFVGKDKPANLDQIRDGQLERAVDVLKGILIFRSHE